MANSTLRILAQIAPQRSTQYAAIASHLATPELQLAPLGVSILDIEPCSYGNEDFLLLTLDRPLPAQAMPILAELATTTVFFEYFAEMASNPGPFLRPLPTNFAPNIPYTLVSARRYRGKTNELFTHFLCNIARYSSSFATKPWSQINILDPLAGGGTIPFTGLVLGAHVAGIDHSAQDIKSAANYLDRFLRESGIPFRGKEERLRKLGRRWRFSIGARNQSAQSCMLICAETNDAQTVLNGFRPHLVVTDLPYGIQHHGALTSLLSVALPIWSSLLRSGGALVFAWDATRFPRADMVKMVKNTTGLDICQHGPYDSLAHGVDRVIKQRDVLVATKS